MLDFVSVLLDFDIFRTKTNVPDVSQYCVQILRCYKVRLVHLYCVRLDLWFDLLILSFKFDLKQTPLDDVDFVADNLV
jgi:hypothetical protein